MGFLLLPFLEIYLSNKLLSGSPRIYDYSYHVLEYYFLSPINSFMQGDAKWTIPCPFRNLSKGPRHCSLEPSFLP